MNIEQFKAFVYVALTGSFSKAGEILFVSQPSISARIKSLEESLGYPLFHRKSKNITLTTEGETFLPFAENILDELLNGLDAIQQKTSTTKGVLNIASVLTVAQYILPELISEFHTRYPNVIPMIQTGHSHNVLDMVLNHEVPLGISRSVSHPDIHTVHLIDDEMILAVYPEHSFFDRSNVTIEDVAQEPLILFNRGSVDRTLIDNTFNSMNVVPNVVMEVDNIELVKQMIKKRLGIGLLPKFAIENTLKKKSLGIVNIDNLPQLSRPFQLIYSNERKIDGVLKIFVDFIKEKLHSQSIS